MSTIEQLKKRPWVTEQDLLIEREDPCTSMKIIDAYVDDKGIGVKIKVWNGQGEVVNIIRTHIFRGSKEAVEIPGEFAVASKHVHDLARRINGLEIWGFAVGKEEKGTVLISTIEDVFISDKGLEITVKDKGNDERIHFTLLPRFQRGLIRLPYGEEIITDEQAMELAKDLKDSEIKINNKYFMDQIRKLMDGLAEKSYSIGTKVKK